MMSTDKSPTQYSLDLKTAKNLANLSFEQRLQIQETLRQMEAKDWIKRYNKKLTEDGKLGALAWWQQVSSELVKKRGTKAVNDLRRRMNETR